MQSYPSIIRERHEPDEDAIEMFCGQIPRNIAEDELRLLFERYGRIYKLNILRDKHSGESRGCCFVTYFSRQSALDAQKALHNALVLPGMHHALQMKPADLENRNERKIFIGMISKSCQEEDIRQLFLPFGVIEECTVLRDLNHRSRGCAFVTYEKRQSALNAIRFMHHSRTMEGCSSPINVRLADTPKDKEARKMQQTFSESLLKQSKDASFTPFNLLLFNQLYSNAVSSIQTSSQTDRSSGDHNAYLPLSNTMPSDVTRNRSSSILPWQSLGAFGDHARSIHSSMDESILSHKITAFLQEERSTKISGQHRAERSFSHMRRSRFVVDPSAVWSPSSTDEFRLLDGFLSASNHQLNREETVSPFLSIPKPPPALLQQHNNNNNNNNNSQTVSREVHKQVIGPFGSNLFIYHLPSEFTDQDLAQTFSPFGNVLSAKVFIDKATNRSKCFGFVSYDNIYAAHRAIEHMNGFSIGNKRLKVQLKKTS